MKKLILVLITLIIVNLIGCSNNNTTTYSIPKDQGLKVGEDLPSGTYILQAKEDNLPVSVTKKDGTSLISQFITNPTGDKFVEYKIKLPKDTTITTGADAILIKK